MTENNFVKKMVAGIKRGHKNASYDRHIMHPEREWFLLVFCGLIVFSVGVGFNIVTDQKFKNVSVSYGSEEEEQIVYRQGLVESALSDFAERKTAYEALKASLAGQEVVEVAEPVEEPVVVSEAEASEVEPESVVEVAEPVDMSEIRAE